MPTEAFLVFALLVALTVVAIANAASRRGRDRPAAGSENGTDQLRFRRILVPSFGQPAPDRAVTLACKLARPDGGTVEVLYVVEVPMSLPATADLPEQADRAGDAIARAEGIGRRFGVPVRGIVTKSRFAGKAIVDAASGEGADLIVLPDPSGRHDDWGRTGEYVLRNSPCNVIIERAVRP